MKKKNIVIIKKEREMKLERLTWLLSCNIYYMLFDRIHI
jgi:hypothetical protein